MELCENCDVALYRRALIAPYLLDDCTIRAALAPHGLSPGI